MRSHFIGAREQRVMTYDQLYWPECAIHSNWSGLGIRSMADHLNDLFVPHTLFVPTSNVMELLV